MFVGWGQQPYFSEYNSAGRQDFDAHFISPTSSYRAYRLPWSAQPPTTPAVAAVPHANGSVTVYGSWNGATDVAGWRVLAGPSASALTSIRSSPKHRFESAITVNSGQPDFALQALGSAGQVLATFVVAATPARIAVYGGSAFVSPSALGGVPVSCLADHPCSIVISVSSGRTLLARSGRQPLDAHSGGVLYFRLSPSARRILARARNHRLPVQVTAQDSSGIKSTTTLNLIPFRTSGTGPPRRLAPTASLQVLGATDFVSSTGFGGVLASCQSAQTCTVTTTLSVGGTVIGHTGPERVGANELGYLIFSLTSQGRSLLAHARGHQLGAHVTISQGATTASGGWRMTAPKPREPATRLAHDDTAPALPDCRIGCDLHAAHVRRGGVRDAQLIAGGRDSRRRAPGVLTVATSVVPSAGFWEGTAATRPEDSSTSWRATSPIASG